MPYAVTVEPNHGPGEHGGGQQGQQQQPGAAGPTRLVGKTFIALVIGRLVVAGGGAAALRLFVLEHLIEIVLTASTQRSARTAKARGRAPIIIQIIFRKVPGFRLRRACIWFKSRGGAAHRKARCTITRCIGPKAGSRRARRERARWSNVPRTTFRRGLPESRLRAGTQAAGGRGAQERRRGPITTKGWARRGQRGRQAGALPRLGAVIVGKAELRARRTSRWNGQARSAGAAGGPTRWRCGGPRRRNRVGLFALGPAARGLNALLCKAFGSGSLGAQLLGKRILCCVIGPLRRGTRECGRHRRCS